jgi:hypothetical protein
VGGIASTHDRASERPDGKSEAACWWTIDCVAIEMCSTHTAEPESTGAANYEAYRTINARGPGTSRVGSG